MKINIETIYRTTYWCNFCNIHNYRWQTTIGTGNRDYLNNILAKYNGIINTYNIIEIKNIEFKTEQDFLLFILTFS